MHDADPMEQVEHTEKARTSYIDHSLGPDRTLQYGFHCEIELAWRKQNRVEVLARRERNRLLRLLI